MAHDTGTAGTAVHACKGHGTRLGSRLGFEAQVDGILSDGACGVGWRLPGEVGPF